LKDLTQKQSQQSHKTSWIKKQETYIQQTQILYKALKIAFKKGWIPHRPSPKQLRFLLLPDKEAFYGGAAGGGKSEALLMGAIMFCHIAGYSAIIFRKTLQDHQLPESLIPRSKEWLIRKASWNGSTYTWTFPSGSTITFGYIDNPDDHFRYQSSAYQCISFDEEPQFREAQFRYLFSRLRRLETQKEIPLRIRGAGNPDGPYVEWVKHRYVDLKTAVAPFIPAKIDDNPGLDKEEYKNTLMYLDPITRARLMNGDWEMKDQGSIFQRSTFTLVNSVPSKMLAVRYWDKASTKPKRGEDPDYTAGVLMATDGEGTFYILDIKHMRGRPAEVEALIRQTAILDNERKDCSLVRIFLEQEPGSSGVDVIDHYTRKVLVGFPFKGDKVTGPKAERAAAFSTTAEAGNVKILLGNWNINGYLDELEGFPEIAHDDRVDASSGAFNMLTKSGPLGGGGVDRSIFG